MSISSATDDRDTDVSPVAYLRFDLIKQKAAEIRGITPDDVTDRLLAEMFGITREQVNRLKLGKHRPNVETLAAIAAALDLPMGDLIAQAGE